MKFKIIMVIAALYLICYLITHIKKKSNAKMFYDSNEISPDLEKIEKCREIIYNETISVYEDDWKNWPEKELYEKQGEWKIFPFYAFGIWEKENCNKCPAIFNFIKNIKGLKLATLSKLSPGMKLTPHKGWASHSNHVIRCHYGLIIPKNCYVSVSDDYGNEYIKHHEKFKWLIFDDSQIHYAENKSNDDRIVLIIDVERPSWIKTGTSNVGDSKELIELVNYFEQKNKI